MRIDMPGRRLDPTRMSEAARRAEAAGFDGLQVSENQHDPFIASSLAGSATETIRITTAIAVAFARSPMTVAVSANDAQLACGGRFVLGLGSQVRAHIERRFSMPWSAPAPRMAEFVAAVRAIWSSWQTGEPLEFSGEHYRHTLMTEFFDPGPNPHGNPPIWIAGVGPSMTAVAGRIADGFFAHPFTTPEYLRDVTLPALARGRERSVLTGVPEVSVQPFTVIVDDPSETDRAIAEVRRNIGFYASTPAYRPVLDHHGWAGSAEAFTAASKRREWEQVAALVTDDMVSAFAVIGQAKDVARELDRRYGSLATSLSFTTPVPPTPEQWATLRSGFARL